LALLAASAGGVRDIFVLNGGAMLELDRLFNDVTERDIDGFLQAGEGLQIEFKETLPSILDLAKNVSAFANAQGGVLLVGVRETKPQIVYSGQDQAAAQVFDSVGKRVRPLPALQMHMVNYRGAIVPVIVVKPHPNGVVVSDAGAFVRVGDQNRPMTPNEIAAKLPPAQDDVTNKHLAEGLASVSKTLAEVQDELRQSQSLIAQAPGLGIGFVLGIVASVIASYIYAALNPSKP
jgi:hypothetical protein